MSDLQRLLRRADEVPAPELWPDIEQREPREPGSSVGRRLAVAALALAVAGAGIGLAATAFFGEERREAPTTEPIDPQVTARIEVGGWPSAVAVGEGGVWVGVHERMGGAAILRVDPLTNRIVATIPMKQPPDQIVTGLGKVWASTYEGDRGSLIYQIEPESNEVVGEILDAAAPMAVGGGSLWAMRYEPERKDAWLLRLDPLTRQTEATISVPITYPPFDFEIGEGAGWILGLDGVANDREDLVRVDIENNHVERVLDVDPGSTSLVAGGGYVWLTARPGAMRLDPQTDQLLTGSIPVPQFRPFAVDQGGVWFLGGERPTGVCRLNSMSQEVEGCVNAVSYADSHSPAALDPATATIWVANYEETVTRIDLRPLPTPEVVEADLDPHVTAEVPVGQFPAAVAVGEGAVWVLVNNANPPEEWFVARIDPATNEVTDRVEVSEASDVTVGGGSVWVTGHEGDLGLVVWRVDPHAASITHTIRLNCTRCVAGEIVATSKAVWAVAPSIDPYPGGYLLGIDPRTNAVVERVVLERPVEDLALAGETLWTHGLTHFRDGETVGATLYRVTATGAQSFLTGEVHVHAGGTRPPVLAVGDRYVWTSTIDGQVVRIDRSSGAVEELGIPGPFYPFGIAEGGVWFRGGYEDARPVIARLDTDTLVVDASLSLNRPVVDAALDPPTGTVWLATIEGPVTRIDLR